MLKKACILVASLDEGETIQTALSDLQSQIPSLPIILVDSNSQDQTRPIATRMGVPIFDAPRGKLNALDLAIRTLDYDYFVLADADTKYPVSWSDNILTPFSEPDVVMTSGASNFQNPFGLFDPFTTFAGAVEALLPLSGHVWGGNSAIRRDAYIASGGYDLSVNQTSLLTAWGEEEFAYPRRISAIGRVVHVPSAVVWKSARRFSPFQASENFGPRAGLNF